MKKEKFDRKVKEFKKIFGFIPPFDRTILLTTRNWTIDIIVLDRILEKYTPGYDSTKCTYNGKPNYSMGRMVVEAYGKEGAKLIAQMMR